MRTVSAWCSSRQGRGEDGVVVEDAGPLLVDAIRGDQRGTAFVAMTDDLEQAVGAELVDRKVAEFVDAEDVRFDVLVQRAFNAAAGVCDAQRVDDFNGTGKQDRLAVVSTRVLTKLFIRA